MVICGNAVLAALFSEVLGWKMSEEALEHWDTVRYVMDCIDVVDRESPCAILRSHPPTHIGLFPRLENQSGLFVGLSHEPMLASFLGSPRLLGRLDASHAQSRGRFVNVRWPRPQTS